MASEGAGAEQLPPAQTLAAAVLGGVDAKCELNVDNLSKPELLTLLSIMEGELEARDVVIEALRARRKEVFLQERYGHFSMTDPFVALQRDFEGSMGEKELQPVSTSPMAVLDAVMAHCRKMQENMNAQLAAAETRQKKLEMEKLQLQGLEQEQRKLSAQLKDEREKNKQVVMLLVRECKQLAARASEEGQRAHELSVRLEEDGHAQSCLEGELASERRHSQQMEAELEKHLAEFDTEREQLRQRLSREEARGAALHTESEELRRQLEQLKTERDKDGAMPAPAPAATNPKPLTMSVAVSTDPANLRATSCQTDLPPDAHEVPHRKGPSLSIPVKPSPGAANYAGMSLPKTSGVGRGLLLSQNENGGEATPGAAATALPAGVSPRVQAARYKFQPSPSEQDQNGTANQSPPARDLSPTNRDNFVAKQQARHTVTQVLSRFTSPPAGNAAVPGPGGGLRPGLPHSISEGGPFAGRLGHPQIGLKSPTVTRIDRGNPPPIPPKKPGLSQTPSPPHPPVKVAADGGGRSAGTGMVGSALSGKSGAPTPQLPPKPALELGGTVPALTASQVGAPCTGRTANACAGECPSVTTVTNISIAAIVSSPSINPTSPPSCSSHVPGSPLATVSGWCPSIVPPLTCGDPVPLDDGHTLLQAASQGNVTLLSMLLNQDPTTDISHLQLERTSALFSAARNGHTDCVKLLLSSGVAADVPDQIGFTPLHTAASHGHHGCIEALVAYTSNVDVVAPGGRTPLFLDGCTALHAAVSSGHLGAVQVLLCHPGVEQPHGDPHPQSSPHLPPLHPHASFLNQINRDGWTAAHIAAARGLKDCLGLLCAHSEQDIEKRDKCSRTIHDVATDDCKDLLENLYSYRVVVRVHTNPSQRLCPTDLFEDGPTIGTVTVQRHTSWEELSHSLTQMLTSHLQLLCGGWDLWERAPAPTGTPLGISAESLATVTIGDIVWLPGEEPPQSPWDLIRKRLNQGIALGLKGLAEGSLEELAYDSLIPLQLLQNYTRLVEQYRNVIFHGLEGSCQEYIANQISHCVKFRQEAAGLSCDVVRVEVDENLSKAQLLKTFINSGFLVHACEGVVGGSVVIVLEGLERASSLCELLGDLCEALENRGTSCSLSPQHGLDGLYYFPEQSFLIGSLVKPRLQGAELRLQQHFRWVQLRWDSEPVHSLLGRHLRRKLLHKTQGQVWSEDPLRRILAWVCSVWHQLNTCLSHLGTPEALLGPHIFLSCPVVPDQTLAVFKWLARLWNAVVVPRVEDAVVSRVMAKRSPAQRRSPSSNKSLSCGQRAVLRAVLSILLNKAVFQSCPLPHPEIDRHLSEFKGGTFPLSTIGFSCKKSVRKGKESGPWRRANTSPRKKVSPTPLWNSSSSLHEGSLSCSIVHLMAHVGSPRNDDGHPEDITLCSDDETDLLRELQSMCTSKSEPDISKITHSRDDFSPFSRCRRHEALIHTRDDTGHDTAPSRLQRAANDKNSSKNRHSSVQAFSQSAATTPSTERRSTRPKSQLPVPSSRGPQRASVSPRSSRNTSSSSSSSLPPTTPTYPSPRAPARSRTRQDPPHNNHQATREDIWVFNPNLHDYFKKPE
ncbi:cortactin-binding protein 2 isoform X2 [Denticeps clupeoides]|uniref:cortactin-binding protein 2 isoform X2 n=1 Tax=Denticeps clupeoides TaxID=299321 RepID=UPI0010A34674|nr:cortactin-binding protein 2 isoform X2 [Denticeps clupeoides]